MYLLRIAGWVLLVFQLPVACFCQHRDSTTVQAPKKVGMLDRNLESGATLIKIFKLHTIVRLQQKELNVYKKLKKIDTVGYGTDSLLINFIGINGHLLKKTERTYDRTPLPPGNFRKYHGDSVITYFNNNGSPDYYEMWERSYKFKYQQGQQSPTDTIIYWSKVAYARYEYDDQDRLMKYVKVYSHETVAERSVSYDPQGKEVLDAKRIDEWQFWGDLKDVLKD